MKFLKNLLIIGGTGRNTGKTELICTIISKISRQCHIYGAKTTDVAPRKAEMAAHTITGDSGWLIYEEENKKSGKDTSRMLGAGAHRVYYLQSNDENVAEGFLELLNLLPENTPLVCESNTLADHFKPGLFLVVTRGETRDKKIQDRLIKADAIIISDGCSGFAEADRIRFTSDGWQKLPA
jgi:Ni2+-binding GTPase involved in maturation of urease and hydrogenase